MSVPDPVLDIGILEGALVVRLHGEIDLAAVPPLAALGTTLGEGLTSRDVVIDLAAVGFVDGAGARALWSLRQRFREAGAEARFRGATPPVQRVLRLVAPPTAGTDDGRAA